MISGHWTSSSSPHQLCQGESVRSPVLSVICFITRHSSFSSRSKVRSPGGKRHLGGVVGKSQSYGETWVKTCWNPIRPGIKLWYLMIFGSDATTQRTSHDLVSILSGFCKLLKLPYPCSHNGNWWLTCFLDPPKHMMMIRPTGWPCIHQGVCLWSAACSRNAFNVTVFNVHCATVVYNVRTYNCKKNRIDI